MADINNSLGQPQNNFNLRVNELGEPLIENVYNIEFEGAIVTDEGDNKVKVSITSDNSSPFIQEANGAIHRTDVADISGGENSTNLTFAPNQATGLQSHADSNGVASGVAAHGDSEGYATGNKSHADSGGGAEGGNSNASAGGLARGDYSNASGAGSVANSFSETAVGCGTEDVTANDVNAWNAEDLSFHIGIGDSTLEEKISSFFAYKNGGFKFISRSLTNITNAVKGFFAYDENGRPNAHDGTQWNPLAYLSEVGGGAVDSVNGQTGVVVLDADDVKAIPRGGTTVGNPVTGPIEFEPEVVPMFQWKDEVDNYNDFYPFEAGFSFRNNETEVFVFRKDGGLEGTIDYSSTEPSNLNIYAQRQYVENVADKIKSKYLFANGASLTGVTGEAVIQTLLIPANTYDSIDAFLLNVPVLKSVTSGSINYKFYHGTSSGATTNQIGILALSNVNRINTFGSYYNIEGGFLNSTKGFATNLNAPYAVANGVNTPIAFDHTVDNWITVTANPSVTTEVCDVLNITATPLKY